VADNTASDCANKRAEGLCVPFILGVVYGNFCGKNGNNINGFSFLFGIQLIGLINIGGNDSNLLIVFYVQIMPDDFVMQLHRF